MARWSPTGRRRSPGATRRLPRYLNDDDPARAAKYGFRSGQTPRLAWSWFRDNPVGFNGVPYVLFKTIIDLDPNDPNPTLRAVARIWKREAVVPTGSRRVQAGRWTTSAVGPGPADYDDGVARPAGAPFIAAVTGSRFENSADVRAAVAGARRWAPIDALAARVSRTWRC